MNIQYGNVIVDDNINEEDVNRDNMSMEEWWDYCQTTKNLWYLTGSKGHEVWERLNITDKIYPGQVVLNIGVGLGYCTGELVRKKCVVHVLDISEVALNRVKDIVAKAWLPSRLADLPVNTFDLAISNLVTQHMTNTDLLEQMHAVTRSLKHDGIFAMQFAYSLSRKCDSSHKSPKHAKNGVAFRSLLEVNSLVEETQGKILWVNKIGNFPEYNIGWYGVHIVKKDGSDAMSANCSLENISDVARVFNEEGIDLLKAGDIDSARAAFLHAVELNPEFAIAHNNLGLVSCHRGKYKGAVKHFVKAGELDPSNSTIVENVGKVSKTLGPIK
ncbi:MAG: tetratricopeptide repeat protein [Planctomycetota bacterium]|jgi:tetratricopeptide (TPR) repeat protein